MNILYVAPFYDPAVDVPEGALNQFPIFRQLPAEVARLGHDVRLLALGPTNVRHQADGVRFEWIAPSRLIRFAGARLHSWKPYYGPAYYQPSVRLARRVRALQPDIVHVFGMTIDPQLALISQLKSVRSRLVTHYHGGLPAQGPLRRGLQRVALGAVDAALFTTLAQGDAWVAADSISPSVPHRVLETSTTIQPMDQQQAREVTGMRGDPVYLSTGRLHPIKDPITMLRGFALIARHQPEARLYLYYLTDEMLAECRRFVASRDGLAGRVSFCGRAAAGEMASIYSSADVLLQASLREWSGLAVLEAMACGCIPVLTDIPSFSEMTDRGVYGRLFPIGESTALADAALSIEDHRSLGTAIQRHFERRLSFAAIARDVDLVYRELAEPA